MPQIAAPNTQADVDRLEVAADEAIAACGGDMRAALKALIVANEFLESEVCELMQAVSHARRGNGRTRSLGRAVFDRRLSSKHAAVARMRSSCQDMCARAPKICVSSSAMKPPTHGQQAEHVLVSAPS